MTIAGKNSLPGEAPGQKLVRIVRHYAGCSLLARADELGALVGRGVDDPKRVVTVKTNCGMFALGVMAEAGVDSAILDRPYLSKTGLAPGANAIAWLIQLGTDRGALVKLATPGVLGAHKLKPGSLLRYNTAGRNDDHVEWLLSEVDAKGHAEHGGGGRTNNAISITKADAPNSAGLVAWNYGRPLVEYWDPDLLGIEVVPVGSDINEAYPDSKGSA